MTQQMSQGLAILLCGVVLAFEAAGIILIAVSYFDAAPSEIEISFGGAFDIVLGLPFLLVGTFIAVKRPGNLVGWALLLSGTSLVGTFLGVYAELSGLPGREPLPGARAVVALEGGLWTPLMAGVFFLILLFPTGRLPSPRWRWPARYALIGFPLAYLGITFMSPTLETEPFLGERNPLLIEALEPFTFLAFIIIVPLLVSIVAAGVSLLRRFRHSHGVEREQFKWLAFSAGLLVSALPVSGTAGFGVVPLAAKVADLVFTFALFALPLSVGVAVMQYRLYDIDRIISRTLTYGLLTAVLAAMYFGLVVGLQRLLEPLSGGSDLAIVVTTLSVAALFLPARRRVQSAVDRRFNRHTYDAQRTIEAFSARLREEIDLDTLRYELLAVVEGTMQPARAGIWLRGGARNDLGTS